MLKFLRKIRKGFRTACLTAALTTCWQIGQVANATINPPPNVGDEVTIQFSGTVSPTMNNISHLFLIYQTGYSSWAFNNAIKLGDFISGESTPFSVTGKGHYDPLLIWYTAGLYGDISSGQYIEGVNGVVLGVTANVGDMWNTHCLYQDERTVFNELLNDDPFSISGIIYTRHGYDDCYLEVSATNDLFNFSQASNNGTIQIQSEIVPEPISIVLFGGGGLIIVAFRRQKK